MIKGNRIAGRFGVALLVLAMACVLATPAEAQYGRTEFGYQGAALGAGAGGALGAGLAAAAGIANPLLGGTLIATGALGGGYFGGRLGSGLGNELDNKWEPRKVWAVVGAVTGGLLGYAGFPGGSMMGKVIGGAVGAFVGGWLGDHFADKLDGDYNPRTVGALVGGVQGALLAGPFGAAVGAPLGYIGGDVFDRHVFVDPDSKLEDWYRRNPDGRDGRGSRGSGAGGYGAIDFNPQMPDDLDPDVYDRYGYDREGFDWTGYNRDGFDREGYDRAGYDHRGVDRQGYDRRGYERSQPGTDSTSGTAATTGPNRYDPDLYRDYWAAWSRAGGRYPELDDRHWQYFPREQRVEYRESYMNRYNRQVTLDVEADFPPGTTLAEKRRAYRDAIERFRTTMSDPKTPQDIREAAFQKIAQLERDLNRDLGGF